MTRKDYKIISSCIARAVELRGPSLDANAYAIVEDIIDRLACELVSDNPRFDATRFREACGLDKDV